MASSDRMSDARVDGGAISTVPCPDAGRRLFDSVHAQAESTLFRGKTHRVEDQEVAAPTFRGSAK
jgi:hypothetical protein